MSRAEHYREAERLLELADRPDNHPDASKHYLGLAQVHAILATAEAHVAVAALEDT